MRRVLHGLAVGISAFVYGFIGLLIGASTGLIILNLTEILFDVTDASPAILQLAVATWAVILALLAVIAYLRSAAGDGILRGGN